MKKQSDYPHWDWKIRSYRDRALREFCMETVHRGEQSKDMELRAIESSGRVAVVTNLHAGTAEILEPHSAFLPLPPKADES